MTSTLSWDTLAAICASRASRASVVPVVAEVRTFKPAWNNAHLLEGELVDAVRALKASDGPGITVLGSGSVAAQLGDAGLVDEYQFVVVPITLGAGRTVFTTARKLRLVEHRAFGCGNVVLTYEAGTPSR